MCVDSLPVSPVNGFGGRRLVATENRQGALTAQTRGGASATTCPTPGRVLAFLEKQKGV